MIEHMAYLSEKSTVSKIHNQNLCTESLNYCNVQHFVLMYGCDKSVNS